MEINLINPVDPIPSEVTFPHKRKDSPSHRNRKDAYDDELEYYIEITKASPIDREALLILLRIEVGTSLCECLKEAFI